MIVSPEIFDWFASTVIGGTAVGWLIVELVRLRRELGRGSPDRDRVFGSIIAIAIMLVGVGGVLKHHLW